MNRERPFLCCIVVQAGTDRGLEQIQTGKTGSRLISSRGGNERHPRPYKALLGCYSSR